ncbi:BTAD domain-containing putative transcriptional regulator [Amycolatopsis anabasis]|uniref:BTAD domain-containing putative transcriptional regulator n=1 Tax=Amycolatopsis anabasis TaxID=1840409 RepID=UPI00131EA729|nr:BTAD domain-containing putative transcriptional regulator [Amycolatopsis anabasis]
MGDGQATFGAALRAHRIRARLTQAELAARAGVSVRSVRNIEQGKVVRPRRESARRLAEAVGLPFGSGWLRPDDRTELRIEVLGPLGVSRDGHDIRVGSGKHRCLLALLALQPGELVSRDEIVDVLWGDDPPASSRNLVHTYASGLRKSLGAVIGSERGGYRLDVAGAELDLVRFDELAARARRLRHGDPESALDLFEQAMARRRAPVVADLPASLRQHPVAVAVADRVLSVALSYAETALVLGRDADVVERLRPLVHEEPLHEGLHARLMLALAGSGQQAAALRLFTEIRNRLVDELGIEPGGEIQAAHMRIVRNNLPAPVRPADVRAEPGTPAPAQLPADVTGFVGRADGLARLDAVLPNRRAQSPMAIAVIEGTAGVGKTALAVHWAHRVRERFPDGQLQANLRGFAAGPPVRPLDVLTRFLRALGVAADRVPADEEEAAGLYRTKLADREVLILLDNAADAGQVRPLLPGSPGCLVLITSRARLTGLAAAEGAHRLTLDVLDARDARALLAGMLGRERVDAEPEAVTALVRTCAHLPLALRIAAANLISVPHAGIAEYTAELRARGRLAELSIGGDSDAVRAAFDASYTRLDPATRRLFRLLGLVPGPDFTPDAAAALADDSPARARRLLGRLADAHLVHEEAPGRYQFHDLLREYAAALAVAEDGPAGIQLTVERLFAFYLDAADTATRLLYPHVLRMPVTLSRRPAVLSGLSTEDAAIEWLDAERANLFAAATRAAEFGLAHYSWRIADALRGYLWTRGCSAEGLAACQAALRAARHRHDERAEASMHDLLGLIHYNLSDYRQAISCHSNALTLSRRAGNRMAEASSLHNLGRVYSQTGLSTRRRRATTRKPWRSTGNPGTATARSVR